MGKASSGWKSIRDIIPCRPFRACDDVHWGIADVGLTTDHSCIVQAFGVNRRRRRVAVAVAVAASKMHLFREAEQVLRQPVSRRVEDVEETGVEYWNLRKLIKEHDEIRRIYEGLEMKLDVLQREGITEAIEKTRARMTELKARFTSLKEDCDRVAALIAEGYAEVDIIDPELAAERQKHRAEASVAFQQIGQANRDISSHKAQLGLIDTQMSIAVGGEAAGHCHATIATNCRVIGRKCIAPKPDQVQLSLVRPTRWHDDAFPTYWQIRFSGKPEPHPGQTGRIARETGLPAGAFTAFGKRPGVS